MQPDRKIFQAFQLLTFTQSCGGRVRDDGKTEEVMVVVRSPWLSEAGVYN